MNTKIIRPLSLTLLTGLCVASESHAQEHDWTQDVKEAMRLYADEESYIRLVKAHAVIQYQMADVQPNGSNGSQLKEGASPVNQEFRRFWLGLTVETASDTTLHGFWKLGGLPVRESYSQGLSKKNYSYGGIFDLWIKQDIHALEGSSVKVGKLAPLFTDDYICSSSKIKTIERSLLTDQYGFESNWGVEMKYESAQKYEIFFQLLANDRASLIKPQSHDVTAADGRGVHGEFSWQDKCFAILGGSTTLTQQEEKEERLTFQYTHDFNNIYDGKREAGPNCFGIGVKDALALGYHIRQGKLSISNTLLNNFELAHAEDSGNGNNIGLNIMPVYALSPHLDLVTRYTFMTGDGACRLGANRYIGIQTTAPSYADSLQSVYAGINYYYSAINPDSAKWMTGIEYTTARKDSQGCYSGWTLTTALRFAF